MEGNSNAAVWFVDRHAEEGRSEKVVFREAGGFQRTITYGELSERTGLIAGAFGRAGILQGERVACLLLDQLEYPEIFWGALKAGVIPVPLNTLLATPVYDAILRDSRAACLIVSSELFDVVSPAIESNPFLRRIIVVGENRAENAQNYTDFLSGVERLPALQVGEEETAFWLYSSGSTGAPKGVCHMHRALKVTADNYGAQILGIREDDTVYSAAKIFFAYGLGNAMTFPMSVGATTVLYGGRPTPDVLISLLENEKPTIFCGVPTLYASTLALMERQRVPETKLRICISAGEALPENVGVKWCSMLGVDILDGVGSTEMLHIFLSNKPGDIVYGTSGTAVPGYDLRCVDENGEQIAVGEIGELIVRGRSSATEYWQQREKSRETFMGQWTRTGDKYELTDKGRYIYYGRTDDMFKVSGIWVSPFEVEQALAAHASVLEAAVVSATDENGLEKPKAYVVLKQQADTERMCCELKDFVKEQIGKWKYPRWIEIVESLPKTATGKIQRFKLRADA